MTCKDCVYCTCIGTRVEDNVKEYECHKDKPRWLGEVIENVCEHYEARGNVIYLFGCKGGIK